MHLYLSSQHTRRIFRYARLRRRLRLRWVSPSSSCDWKEPFEPSLSLSMAVSCLNPTQRYAAGALLALALRQAQIHQSRPLGAAASAAADADEAPERFSSASSSSVATATSSSSDGDGDGDAAHLWTNESRGLLRPVFRLRCNPDSISLLLLWLRLDWFLDRFDRF